MALREESDFGSEVQWGSYWLTAKAAARWEADGLVNPTPKPKPVEPVLPTTVDLEVVPARRLRADVIAVYQQLGGQEYLRKIAQADPQLYGKLLLKLLPQTVESDVRMEVTSNTDLKHMTTDQLKLMIMERLAKDAITVQPEE